VGSQAELRLGPVFERALPSNRRRSCSLPPAVEFREFRVRAFVQDVVAAEIHRALITIDRDPFAFAKGAITDAQAPRREVDA